MKYLILLFIILVPLTFLQAEEIGILDKVREYQVESIEEPYCDDFFIFPRTRVFGDDPNYGDLSGLDIRWFAAFSYSQITFEDDLDIDGAHGRFGYVMTDFFKNDILYATLSWELGLTMGMKGEEVVNDLDVKIGDAKMEYMIEPALRLDVVLLKRLRVYGLAGWSFSRYRDLTNFNWKPQDSYFLGLGTEVKIYKSLHVFAEIREYYDFDDDVEQVLMGVAFRF